MQRTIYLSPSNHGVGVNKCLHTGCYEDKHTRPMANEAARHLKTSGFYVIVADENRGVVGRCQDANRLGVDLYVPIHTNAAAAQYRYLLAMAWDPTNKDTARLYDCFKQTMGASYNGSVQLWKRRNLIEINTPKMLSFYIEAGFHTNQQDCDNYIHDAKARGKELAQMICMFYSAGQNAATFNIGDISSWNTSNVTNMGNMFTYTGQNATTFDIGNIGNWDTSKVTSSTNMFYGCNSLVGQSGTSYDSTKVDVSMANYSTGYLTYKAT